LLLRRLRGLVGTGLTWAVGWAAIAMAIGLVVGWLDPDSIDPGEGPLRIGSILGLVGFVSGVGFGLVLAVAERRRQLADLSVIRAALWGALGAAALPLLTSMENSTLLNVCPLGALFGAASVALARRGERLLPDGRSTGWSSLPAERD
jgi:hypothetical protein